MNDKYYFNDVDFPEELNLKFDEEHKLHKKYLYEGDTTINFIVSDIKEIHEVIQGILGIK